MNDMIKRAEDLKIADLKSSPIWQFINDDALGETAMCPVKKLPVKNLIGCIVGTQVQLANGSNMWAIIGNVDMNNLRLTQLFLTLSIFQGKRCFTLARYHDSDADQRGSQALADFLGLRVDEVFPIAYDISQLSLGNPAVLIGKIEKELRERLTRAQLIALAVP